MRQKFKNINRIENREIYNKACIYVNDLINEATQKGALSEHGADNEYTREIGRVGELCADYENNFMHFDVIKVKSPLLLSIEEEMNKRSIKQYQAAQLLNVKESTFSQVMTGKRPVSMRMAKRLYKVLNIDPKLILEYS